MSPYFKFVVLPMTFVGLIMIGLSVSCHAGGVIAVGDSLTAQPDSWPSYLQNRYVQIQAQNGRTIRDFDFSGDLTAHPNVDTVVYMLGVNDILQGTNNTTRIKDMMKAHLVFLKARGFKVLVIVPPVLESNPAASERVRNMIIRLASNQKIPTVDLNTVWDINQTSDTVHPLPTLSCTIALAIDAALDLSLIHI